MRRRDCMVGMAGSIAASNRRRRDSLRHAVVVAHRSRRWPCASALFFSAAAGLAAGRLASSVLAPLPFLLAGLGWGIGRPDRGRRRRRLALLALVAVLGFAHSSSPSSALPACWLAYLALLSRPRTARPDASARMVSAGPPDRGWAAIMAGACSVLRSRSDRRRCSRACCASRCAACFERVTGGSGPTARAERTSRHRRVARALLAAGHRCCRRALARTAVTSLNLWLAGRISAPPAGSPRPWPDFAAIDLSARLRAAPCWRRSRCRFVAGHAPASSATASPAPSRRLPAARPGHRARRHRAASRRARSCSWRHLCRAAHPGHVAALLIALLGLLEPLFAMRARLASPTAPLHRANQSTRTKTAKETDTCKSFCWSASAKLGQMGDVVSVKDGYRPQLPAAAGQGAARHRGQPEALRERARPARSPQPRAARRRPRRSPRSSTASLRRHPPGRRYRPALRLGSTRDIADRSTAGGFSSTAARSCSTARSRRSACTR